MRKNRWAYILKGTVMADNALLTQQILSKEPISAILVNVSVTNGATSNTALRPEDAVSKIEITDGAKVIFSMPGWLAKACDYWHDGITPPSFYDQGPAAVQTGSFVIPFGHFIGDPDYYLDPAKYQNLQIRITNTMTISATAGWATGTFTVTVLSYLFTDTPNAQKGFFIGKDIFTFTTAASGDQDVVFPRDLPYRMIVVRTFLTATDFETLITNAKVTCDNGNYIPFDMAIADIRKLDAEYYLNFREKAVGFGANAYAMKYPVGKLLHADCVPYTALTFGGMASVVNDTGTIATITVTTVPAIALGAAMRFGTEYGGYYPYFSFMLPFGDLASPDNYFNPTAWQDVRMKLTQGAANGVTDVALIQLAGPNF